MRKNIQQFYEEWQALQPLNETLERNINQQFMIDFNYNSNHLEGNTLSYGQTKLLLLFGDTIGNATIQDYEEMKAHNVGLEMMKAEAKDKNRMLSEHFIRELNQTILVRDFYKTSRDGDFRYKINVGVYKTRPNSVITPTGEVFDYASPEETPSLMGDLVEWYRNEEQRGKLKAEELAALFHYRYIRIHPFEDGNGRIARLFVNYILLRHNYPMIVIRTDDRQNYLKTLHQCDLLTGKIPYDGARATLQQVKPLVDYISAILENKLTALIQLAKGEISEFVEAKDDEESGQKKVVRKSGQKRWSEVLELIKENPKITRGELSDKLGINPSAIQRHIQKLKTEGVIKRTGGDKGGKWIISALICFICVICLPKSAAFAQPVFYSQSLHKLYYSLPASCRLENPVADTVVSCAGILPGMNVPVAYSWDGYGILAHIGYRFLRGVDSLPFHPAVARFLERELLTLLATDDLEQKLNTNRENNLILLHNGNTPQRGFYRDRNGLPLLLQTVSGMDVRYLEGKKYEVRLTCGQGQTLTFEFVADAELLSDMDKKERDERLAAQLKHHRAKTAEMPPHVPACNNASMNLYLDSVYVCRGSSFIIPQINNNLYYLKTGSTFALAFSWNWIAESLSNVLLASAGNDYTVHITHRQYGGVIYQYEVTSRDFFDYFSDNYDRYFGIEAPDNDKLTGTLILVDRSAGSIHLAHVSVSLWDLMNGGTIYIRLDSNIPQHNVETLFGNMKNRDNNKPVQLNKR